VLFVTSTAMTRGPRTGVAAALGIVGGNIIYFALSATGIAALILAAHSLFVALKWAGAIYLVWIGLRLLLVRAPAADIDASPVPANRAGNSQLLRGLLVQLSNPKALIFFVALLPQFITLGTSIAWQVLVLGVSSQLIEITVMSLYIALATRVRRLTGNRWERAIERTGGGFLVVIGLRVAAGANT
jgi:homoserine/homoserine lactone efflux protein